MSGILVSRIFGFLREMVIASFFGLSPQVDAFYAAYRIPNFFRTLLGEGSLSAAFIPVLSKTRVEVGGAASVHLTRAFLSIILMISGGITLLGVTFSSAIVSAIAPGFSPETHDLASGIMRIIFPFFAFLALGAWAMGILHSRRRFFLPSIAPVCLSGSQIVFVIFFGLSFSPEPIYALAWGVLAGGALQFLVQVPALVRLGYSVRPAWDPALGELRRIGVLFLPVVIALGINQISSLVDTFLSSFLEGGSLATLSYAARLYTFPLGLFGSSIVMVALPTLSRAKALEGGEDSGHIDRVREWWLKTLFFLIPSAVFLLFFASEVVGALFERGAFGPAEVDRVGGVLLAYAVGLPACGSVKLLASGVPSPPDTRTPMNKALAATLVNIVLSVILMRVLGVRGIALATSIAAYLHLGLLASGLSVRGGRGLMDGYALRRICLIIAGSAIMIITGLLAWRFLLSGMGGEGEVFRFLRLFILMALMGGSYMLMARTSGFGYSGRR